MGDQGVDGSKILKQRLNKQSWGYSLAGTGQEPMAGPPEHSNEPLGSVKDDEKV